MLVEGLGIVAERERPEQTRVRAEPADHEGPIPLAVMDGTARLDDEARLDRSVKAALAEAPGVALDLVQ